MKGLSFDKPHAQGFGFGKISDRAAFDGTFNWREWIDPGKPVAPDRARRNWSHRAVPLAIPLLLVLSGSRPCSAENNAPAARHHVAHARPAKKNSAEKAAGKSAESPQVQDALRKEIIAHLAGLLPAGTRIKDVKLQCEITKQTKFKSLAPGITRLVSPNFLVELDDGGQQKLCTASVQAEREVLFAVRNVQLGEPVSAKDFAPRWVDAFFGAPGALDRLPDLHGAVAAMPIQANQPLYSTSLRRPTAVRPGDMVAVYVKNGAVRVRAMLQSRSTASVGDTAIVVNPQTGVPVVVKVTGVRTAEMVMEQ